MTHITTDFVQGIVEDPLEDQRRLVYADWLDENGEQDRAAFIRVQMGLQTTSRGNLTADEVLYRNQMLDSERRLLGTYWRSINKEMIPLFPNRSISLIGDGGIDLTDTRNPSPTLRCRRGFVNSLSCTYADFLSAAGRLFKVQPVTGVRIVDKKADVVASSTETLYAWYGGEVNRAVDRPTGLPMVVFKHLKYKEPISYGSHHAPFINYPSELHALKDASRAWVNFGRESAGLNPIELEL